MPLDATTLVQAAGWLNIAAALFHLAFWRLFHWPETLGNLNSVNKGTLYTMNWALTFLFGLIGLVFLSAGLSPASTSTVLWLLYGMSGFFLFRALIHLVYFKLKHPLSLAIFVIALLGSALHFLAAQAVGRL